MFVTIALIVVGSGLLYFGAEWLVRGSAGLATRFGVSPLVIGLTVVSFGTSAPEMAVSVVAALEGQSGIALGNVVGSNIANIGVVLGMTALIAPPAVPPRLWRAELPWLVTATACLPVALIDGQIRRWEGAALLAGAVLFTATTIRGKRSDGEPNATQEAGKPTGLRLALLTGGGLLALAVGGRSFVSGSVEVARVLGLSERTIGLTLVAIGTSLPELSASLVAALRGHAALAVGNVVGSNLLNMLLIVGAAGVTRPLEARVTDLSLELLTLGGFTFVLALSLLRARRVSRVEGGLYLAGYVAFLVALFAERPLPAG